MATLNRRGRAWQLTWSDAGGQHRISLGQISRQEAEVRRKEKELELLTGRRYGASGVTFASFAAEYLIWYRQHWPSTYSRTEGILRLSLAPFFADFDLESITPQDVTKWITWRQNSERKPKPATITKEARTLQAVLNKAAQWRVIDRQPLASYRPPPERTSRPPQFYTADQLQALYAASPNHEHIWRLLANTGLRRNEALYLARGDIGDTISVLSHDDRPTKSRRWRDVPLNANAKAAIEALLAATDSPYLLPRVAPRSLSRAFTVCAKRAGLKGSIHTLRHTFISHMVMSGVDLGTVQKIAGHAHISTTMRYAHLSPGHAMSAVQKIAL